MNEYENNVYTIKDEKDGGEVMIANDVIATIACVAATEVEGVAATRGNLATGVAERFGKKVHSKGVKSSFSEDGAIIIDVYCSVKFGHSIPKVAKSVQTQIRQSIFDMTSIETSEVNVHITGVQFENNKDQEA